MGKKKFKKIDIKKKSAHYRIKKIREKKRNKKKNKEIKKKPYIIPKP